MKHFGDITKLSGYDLPIVDVITGGSPCQDLSVAGKRAGLDGERSGLFMEQIRIIKEMRDHDRQLHSDRSDEFVRPRYMVWENVPGAFSSNKGKDFQAVLTEIVRIAEPNAPDVPLPEKGKWTKSGCIYDELGKWSIAWRVHDAQFWGVPQRRKRIALVADFGGLSAAEILFERKGLCWDSDQIEAARKNSAGAAGGSAESTIGFNRERCGAVTMDEAMPTLQAAATMWDGSDTAPTLTANNAGGEQRMPDKSNFNAVLTYQEKTGSLMASGYEKNGTQEAANDMYVVNHQVRRLTPTECERLQGFPDGWTDIGDWVDTQGKLHKAADSARYKALGNSIALPFWQYLARRICAQYERDVTMGSLFDGIGGFPLVFSRCGAIPVWASEIEEFPIAVTKRHFPEGDEA